MWKSVSSWIPGALNQAKIPSGTQGKTVTVKSSLLTAVTTILHLRRYVFWETNEFPSPLSFLLAESSETPQQPVSAPSSGSVDLNELLQEIRHLRLQLERSIQTNTALRQRLEEQLLRGPNRPETININYLLSSPGKHTQTHILTF